MKSMIITLVMYGSIAYLCGALPWFYNAVSIGGILGLITIACMCVVATFIYLWHYGLGLIIRESLVPILVVLFTSLCMIGG